MIFVPWYKIYPEAPGRRNISFDSLKLTEYDQEVIIPEFQKNNFPRERWGDAIDWYHRTYASLREATKKEYPTTLDELLESGKNEPVFPQSDIDKQKASVIQDSMYNLTEDVRTKKVKPEKTNLSPVKIFRRPILGNHYTLCVDPITGIGEGTDNFAATMMDMTTYEQVATIHGRGIPLEDWAELSVSLCKYFNQAMICPETNVGGEFVAFVRSLGYYRFYYENATNKAKKVPGIRTTVGNKQKMIQRLGVMLSNGKMVLHDPAWVEELETFELKKKVRSDKTVLVKMEARKGKHDDTTMALALFAWMLDDYQLLDVRRSGVAFL